jgi:FAD synthetase
MHNKKVLVFGTYDLFHPGHIHHLKKAAKYGKLYVVVARDATVLKMKGKKVVNTEKNRLKNMQNLDYVYKAILGGKKDKYEVIEKIKPDIICLGYDQTHFTKDLKKELENRELHLKIIKFRKGHKPHIYKSSKLRQN